MNHSITAEARFANLGDERLNRRLQRLVDALAAQPQASVPQALGGWAATKAAYRFWDNDRVTPQAIRAAHFQATQARLPAAGVVLAIQDTTALQFTAHPATTGLGYLTRPDSRGLWVHSVLAVDEAGVPLGLLDQQVWARDPAHFGRRGTRARRLTTAKESQRWLTAVRASAAAVGPGRTVLAVADREADFFDLLAAERPAGVELLVRAKPRRRLHGRTELLGAALAAQPVAAELSVSLPRADDRPARTARLVVRYAAVVLERPSVHPRRRELRPLPLQAVWVEEPAPPAGQPPVRWLLLTTWPVTDPASAVQVVHWYSRRWLIERYHYVLKSGCRVEELQLETAARLERALATYGLVAWRLLWLTYEARRRPEASWAMVLDATEQEVLRRQYGVGRADPAPTLRQAVHWLARLGGFLGRRGDGEPGVQTLWRGWQRLQAMVEGFRLAGQPSAP
jgi:hypothetical protein